MNKPKILSVLIAVTLVTACFEARAQTLVLSWDLTNANAATINPMYSTTTNQPTYSTNGYLSLGSGVTASNVSPAFRAGGFDQITLSNALANNDYLAFTISPLQALSMQQVTFVVKTVTGATFDYNLFSSLTGWTTNDSLYSNNNASSTSLQTNTVDLTGVSALQNVSSDLEFRVYGYRSAAGNTAFEFANGGSILDVGIYATAVPEPSTVALLALGFGAMAFAGRRKIAIFRRRD